jgi:uncharacterized protein
MTETNLMKRLCAILDNYGPVTIAVSGGVDSMTLAGLAARHLGEQASMIHAVSPAVPQAATHRVRRFADRYGWHLTMIDAGEFADPQYRANPANRCFFCKSNLYGAMAAKTDTRLLSGTNLDDLSDWRPGLKAADNHNVAHPFVEAGIDKDNVRLLARILGFDDVADLAAAPCLSSRVETGIRIESADLIAVDRVETDLRLRFAPQTVRCRVRATGVVIEFDPDTLSALDPAVRAEIATRVAASFEHIETRSVVIEAYARGSAFLTG